MNYTSFDSSSKKKINGENPNSIRLSLDEKSKELKIMGRAVSGKNFRAAYRKLAICLLVGGKIVKE